MTILRRATVILFVFAMTVASVQASVITLNYDFEASGFEAAGAPVDVGPVTGSFSVTFDNASDDLTDVTAGISLTGLNISLGSAPAFTYFRLDDTLVIGGLQSAAGVLSTDPPSDDFVLLIWDVSTNPLGRFFAYGQIASGTTFFATEGVGLTPAQVPPIPEPTSVSLLGFGLAGIGVKQWRARKRS